MNTNPTNINSKDNPAINPPSSKKVIQIIPNHNKYPPSTATWQEKLKSPSKERPPTTTPSKIQE